MNSLEKANSKAVHFLFPHVERIYYFIAPATLLAIWSIPETYWPIRVILIWCWFLSNEIHWKGVAERDCLPIQPGITLFYRVYRVMDETAFLFLSICLIVLLLPGPPRLKYYVVGGLLILTLVLRGIGDRKYRPKKPEE